VADGLAWREEKPPCQVVGTDSRWHERFFDFDQQDDEQNAAQRHFDDKKSISNTLDMSFPKQIKLRTTNLPRVDFHALMKDVDTHMPDEP
jgi:hypothetical protein